MITLEKIIDEINKRNLTAFAISKETGISQMQIGRILKGDTKNPQNRTVKILHDYVMLGKSYKDYSPSPSMIKEGSTTGYAKMHVSRSDSNKNIDLGDKLVMLVPLIEEYALSGFLGGYNDDDFLDELPKYAIIVEKYHKGKYFAFKMSGESMDDGTSESIKAGDIILCREIPRGLWNRFHITNYKDYVVVHKEGLLVKRAIDYVDDRAVTLRSLNQDKDRFKDEIVNFEDISLLLNIVSINRQR